MISPRHKPWTTHYSTSMSSFTTNSLRSILIICTFHVCIKKNIAILSKSGTSDTAIINAVISIREILTNSSLLNNQLFYNLIKHHQQFQSNKYSVNLQMNYYGSSSVAANDKGKHLRVSRTDRYALHRRAMPGGKAGAIFPDPRPTDCGASPGSL